jgi:hypothetical protein
MVTRPHGYVSERLKQRLQVEIANGILGVGGEMLCP